jgi:hypothetical protein
MTETAENHQSSEVATTGSDEARPIRTYTDRKPRLKETDLKKRERLIVRYMVYGVDHSSLAERIIRNKEPIAIGEPLTPEEAATLCLIRRSHVRWLLTQPAFQRLVQRETIAFREGAKARAWRKIDELAHKPGDGSAAWAKVNHQAATTITGEPRQGGTTVNVQTNVGVSVKAGLVIRLPPTQAQIEAHIRGEQVAAAPIPLEQGEGDDRE